MFLTDETGPRKDITGYTSFYQHYAVMRLFTNPEKSLQNKNESF